MKMVPYIIEKNKLANAGTRKIILHTLSDLDVYHHKCSLQGCIIANNIEKR